MHERVERWIGCSGREGLISVISPYPARSTHLFDIRSMSSIPGVNLGRGNVMISYNLISSCVCCGIRWTRLEALCIPSLNLLDARHLTQAIGQGVELDYTMG